MGLFIEILDSTQDLLNMPRTGVRTNANMTSFSSAAKPEPEAAQPWCQTQWRSVWSAQPGLPAHNTTRTPDCDLELGPIWTLYPVTRNTSVLSLQFSFRHVFESKANFRVGVAISKGRTSGRTGFSHTECTRGLGPSDLRRKN